jgi:uncharacterized protein (DUF362 family)
MPSGHLAVSDPPLVYVNQFSATTLEATLAEGLTSTRWEEAIPSDAAVFVKPNLTYPRYKQGVTTTPAFLEAVLGLLRSRTRRIWVGESDGGYRGWPAEMAFRFHDLERICARYDAKLVNLSREPVQRVTVQAGKRELPLDLPRLLTRDIEALITVPVPKVHQVTSFSGAVKNQWGCIPNNMRLRYHPFFDEGIMDINRLVHTRLAIMDGTFMLDRNGPIFGSPVEMNTLIVSTDIRAADLAACKVMGIDASKVLHLHSGQPARADDPRIIPDMPPEPVYRFVLQRTWRNRAVAFAFHRRWAVWLIWESKLGDWLHAVLYRLRGNSIQEEIRQLALEMTDRQPDLR